MEAGLEFLEIFFATGTGSSLVVANASQVGLFLEVLVTRKRTGRGGIWNAVKIDILGIMEFGESRGIKGRRD